jgi:hypothetical protein
MTARLLSVALLALLAAAGFAGFRLLESTLAAEVYRERIEELAADHAELRRVYNEAVRRTAVTELRVENGALSVVIRTAAGELEVLPAPFDPQNEIYVDYVVVDGRLWIRRIFDASTPPEQGMLVDPRFAHVDWDAAAASHGKAAYRSLSEGRWVVDVSGDGSLGLARREGDEPPALSPPPPVRDYAPVESAVQDALAEIGPAEALRVIAERLAASVLPRPPS